MCISYIFRYCSTNDNIWDMSETCKKNCGGGGAIYGLGLIGAAVYFIGNADAFWTGVLGFLKALVWPAILVYELLGYLGL